MTLKKVKFRIHFDDGRDQYMTAQECIDLDECEIVTKSGMLRRFNKINDSLTDLPMAKARYQEIIRPAFKSERPLRLTADHQASNPHVIINTMAF